MARRQHVTLTVVAGFLVFIAMTYLLSGSGSTVVFENGNQNKGKLDLGLPESVLKGGSIAPKLENATAK